MGYFHKVIDVSSNIEINFHNNDCVRFELLLGYGYEIHVLPVF